MVEVQQGSEYASVSEYPRVLTKYVSSSECASDLDILGFWICLWFRICQDSEYAIVTQGIIYNKYIVNE